MRIRALIVAALALSVVGTTAAAEPAEALRARYDRAGQLLHEERITEALDEGHALLAEARRAGSRRDEARGFEIIGDAYFYLGRNANALDAFKRELVIWREIGDQVREACALKDVGIACNSVGDYDGA